MGLKLAWALMSSGILSIQLNKSGNRVLRPRRQTPGRFSPLLARPPCAVGQIVTYSSLPWRCLPTIPDDFSSRPMRASLRLCIVGEAIARHGAGEPSVASVVCIAATCGCFRFFAEGMSLWRWHRRHRWARPGWRQISSPSGRHDHHRVDRGQCKIAESRGWRRSSAPAARPIVLLKARYRNRAQARIEVGAQ